MRFASRSGKPRDAPAGPGMGCGRGTDRKARQPGPARDCDRHPRALDRAPTTRMQAARGRCAAGPLRAARR